MKITFIRSGILFILSLIGICCLTDSVSGQTDPVSDLLAKKEDFDSILNGKKVELFTLRNKGGITVQLTNYGGHLVSIITPDKDGKYADILLGYKNIKDYLNDRMMQGCIVGPNVNVIAEGRFTIDGKEYQLPVRNGGNNSHSSPDGFYKEVFDARQEGNKVTLTLKVPDMKTGFPGNRIVTVIYKLVKGDTLLLDMTMTTDKKTMVNMTNHAYFNLAGEGTGDILDHIVRIFADSITPYRSNHIPTGEIISVANTPFDLRQPTPVRKMIDSDNEQIRFGPGYDHNFVLSHSNGKTGIAIRVVEPVSKRFLEIYTNQPGIQFYTGNYLNGKVIGRSGKPYNFRSGMAMEPQKYPDTPHHPNFPSSILEPGKVYRHQIKYVFGVDKR